MPKVKLTNTFVKRVNIPKVEKIRYVDVDNNSLVLEVKSNGLKTFYYKYNRDTKTIYKKIANFPEMNLDEVKEKLKILESNFCIKSNKQIEDKMLDVNQDNEKVNNSLTVEEFYNNYYLPFIKTSKKSFKADVSYFNNHILSSWKNIPLNKLSKQNITNKHIQLLNNELSPSTANKLLKYLSYFYNLAMLWEIPNVNSNPVKNIKPFKVDNLIERYLNKEEINTLLFYASKIDNPFIKPIIETLILTGGRKSEVLNLKWDDVDFNNMILTFVNTKSNRNRKIPISKSFCKVLKEMPRINDYLFPSLKLKNRPFKNLMFYWMKLKKQINLHDVRIHDLRHTFASILVNQGVSLYEVQKLLGHSSISITQRYAHLSNESLKNAVDIVGRVLED